MSLVAETERLRVERVTEADALFYFQLMNSPNYIEYIGDRNIQSINDALAFIKEHVLQQYQLYGFGFYKLVLKSENKAIGICGFKKRDFLDNLDIGYAVLPAYEGKGYTWEALNEVYKYGKNELKLKNISGITSKKNKASQHILEKLGLKFQQEIIEPNSNESILLYY